MVLGPKFGSATAVQQAKEAVYARIREFSEQFKACHGSLVCRDLLGCDLSTSDGPAVSKEKRLFSTICPNYVQSAAEILEEML